MSVKIASFYLLLASSFLLTACGDGAGSSNLDDSDDSSNRSARNPIPMNNQTELLKELTSDLKV